MWQGLMQWVLLASKLEDQRCASSICSYCGFAFETSCVWRRINNASISGLKPPSRHKVHEVDAATANVAMIQNPRRDHVDKYGFDGIRVDAARHINRRSCGAVFGGTLQYR